MNHDYHEYAQRTPRHIHSDVVHAEKNGKGKKEIAIIQSNKIRLHFMNANEKKRLDWQKR